MSNPLQGKRILLGVTGSIAAYKGADLASKLTQAGALVDVVLTEGAEHFVTPLTFQSLTGRKAYTDRDLWGGEGHVTHIGLGRAAELVLIAPASASTIAKLAQGMADNLLTVTVLASECPLMIAPAMDVGMYEHSATQANVHILDGRGVTFIGPEAGRLASGLMGRGRFTEPADILRVVNYHFSRGGPLAGKKIVVTAGGTEEPIDPVRRITNRSSGKQGYAAAEAALNAGADVTLISAPTAITPPYQARTIFIETAEQMFLAALEESADADVLIMAAAVADFRPVRVAEQKIKKEKDLLDLRLEPTTDILAEVGRRKAQSGYPRLLVGFAAESEDLLKNAQKKLEAKNLDMIVANDISATDAGFAVDDNRVVMLFRDAEAQAFPLMGKRWVAEEIIRQVIQRCAS